MQYYHRSSLCQGSVEYTVAGEQPRIARARRRGLASPCDRARSLVRPISAVSYVGLCLPSGEILPSVTLGRSNHSWRVGNRAWEWHIAGKWCKSPLDHYARSNTHKRDDTHPQGRTVW
ncbi:hypothetical protein LIA77_01921 [Sarocladium implicatum]|nr:hypothetical protein LIA77_01921 [Sarocladium implicatum]